MVVPTLRHVPRSVFLSEDARERALENQRRKLRRRGNTAATEREGVGRAGGAWQRDSSPMGDDGRGEDAWEGAWGGGADGRRQDRKAVNDSSRLSQSSNGSRAHANSGSNDTAGPVRSSSGTLDGRESPTVAVDDISHASGRPGDGKAAGDKENDGSGLANGGSRVPGAHWTVSRPFTVDLEAAGVEG